MDLRRVLETLLQDFRSEGVDYALIGGFALGLWGVQRATVDLDFLVHRDSLPAVDRIMGRLGYVCRYRTDNVSQFLAQDPLLGEVDYLHAFRAASVGMLADAIDLPVFGEALRVRVLRPEDLIGLKVQALHNDPRREPVDASDIRELMAMRGNALDWSRIEAYFALFERGALYRRLREDSGA